MKCKSLLPAAAVFACACPAPALAAVAPEPEDASYIRACDAYGKGYFYIPGTETCLRLSGYARADIKTGNYVYTMQYGSRHRSSYAWLARAVLRFHTASQTEWGPLRSFIELRSDWQAGAEYGAANDNTGGALRFGYIELGGLRVGMDESIFAYWTEYYGNIINDDIMNPSDKRTNGISYTFNTAGGFSAVLGVEQGNNYKNNGAIPAGNAEGSGEAYPFGSGRSGGFRFQRDGSKYYKALSLQTHNWSPYIAGGLKYEQHWGSVSTVLGYDTYNSEWAAKLRLDANLTNRFSLFLMGGYKSMEDYYNLDVTYGSNGARIAGSRADGSAVKRYGLYRQVNSIYGDWGGHGIVWLGGTYKFSKQTSFNFQNAYADDKSFSSSANITKQLVAGLTFICELTYKSWNDGYGRRSKNGDVYRVSLKGQEALQGVLRLQRSF